MNQKTNFSFEVQYLASPDSSPDQLNKAIASLEPALQKLLATQDSEATVAVSNSRKGSSSKIVEFTTCLNDTQVAEILKSLSAQQGVAVTALE